MLPVAAAAQARPGDTGTAAATRSGDGLEHLDGVGAQEPVALARLGDPHPHPLARQRVPDEDDAAVVPGHAVAAVGDRADLDLDHVADQSGSAAVPRGAAARRRAHWPRRTEPAVGPSSRSSAPWRRTRAATARWPP